MENIAVFLEYNLDIEKESVWKIAHPTINAGKHPFIVNESGVFYAKEKFFTERYAKNDFQIIYTTMGSADMEYDETKWRLDEGSVAVIDCNKYHDYRTTPDRGYWTYYWIHVGGDYFRTWYDIIYKNGFRPFPIGIDSEFLNHFKETLNLIDSTTDITYIQLNNTVSAILTYLSVSFNVKPISAQDMLIQKAIEYIHKNYNHLFNIDDLSAKINLSKYYFIKLFNTKMGITPYRYLLLHRVNEAKKLLITTDYKINDIAKAVGFADTSNFIKTFTKLTGITPAKYKLTR
jgi:AraC-like DNA-binding protein